MHCAKTVVARKKSPVMNAFFLKDFNFRYGWKLSLTCAGPAVAKTTATLERPRSRRADQLPSSADRSGAEQLIFSVVNMRLTAD